MTSKPKNKNFIVLEIAPYNKKKLGKHKSFNVYYEDDKVIVEYGKVIKDIWI